MGEIDDVGPLCFTIMPFSVREADLARYGNDKSHWTEVYRGLIVPAAREAGVRCEREDDDVATRLIAENIWSKLEAADVVLCDLSAHNPNVYLELGWALRADKRFVLVKDDLTDFNFDLNQFYTYEYSHRLQPTQVRHSVRELADVLRQTLADDSRRYSLVAKLSLQLQAVQAAEGNVEVGLLQELLGEIRSSRAFAGKVAVERPSRKTPNVQIKSQEDLAKFLPGTTWRKSNDLEHLVFGEDGVVWNNHAGHHSWRRNIYGLGDRLGSMTITWGVDGLKAPCEFAPDFGHFVENANPMEARWRLLATEPHTPSWGI